MSTHIPKHVAIIMDGNGRWAARRKHSRFFGHIRGSAQVRAIVREASQQGIKALTLFAFSTENWSRPEEELQVIWKLVKHFLVKMYEELDRENVRLRVIGETERLSPDLRKHLDSVIQKLSKNTGLQLTFAVSYGSRKELARASRLFAEDCVKGVRRPEDMSEALMREYLWTSELGEFSDVDLVIRTSGEVRISNFMLWQAAYAEYYFTELCWPDFKPAHLQAALDEYAKRDRRFGGLKAPVNRTQKSAEPMLETGTTK